jgi:MerR family transcriptional regulator, light-induced transcriptional regulator
MQHTIRIASRRTGLSPHVIRIWERRYSVIASARTESNRRLYSDEDLERLTLLRELTQNGYQIGMVAHLDVPKLRDLVRQELPHSTNNGNGSSNGNGHSNGNGKYSAPNQAVTAEEYQERCVDSLRQMDADGIRTLLEQARVSLGYRTTIKRVVAPLIHRVGEDWQEGDLRIAHESLTTNVVREFLSSPPSGGSLATNAPEIVISTPCGGVHELGAQLVAATARDLGWRVTYLGSSLPAEEISSVARTRNAKAIAISLVYPIGDPDVRVELLRLRSLMPQTMVLILGGRAAESYRQALVGIPGVRWCDALEELENLLVNMALTPA